MEDIDCAGANAGVVGAGGVVGWTMRGSPPAGIGGGAGARGGRVALKSRYSIAAGLSTKSQGSVLTKDARSTGSNGGKVACMHCTAENKRCLLYTSPSPRDRG